VFTTPSLFVLARTVRAYFAEIFLKKIDPSRSAFQSQIDTDRSILSIVYLRFPINVP